MEKVVWKGTFEEAEERDHQYWAEQTPEYRLRTLLEIREMLYPDASPRIEKVAFTRKWGEEDEKE